MASIFIFNVYSGDGKRIRKRFVLGRPGALRINNKCKIWHSNKWLRKSWPNTSWGYRYRDKAIWDINYRGYNNFNRGEALDDE